MNLSDHLREASNDGLEALQFLLDFAEGRREGSTTSDRVGAASSILDTLVDTAFVRALPPGSALDVVLINDHKLFRNIVRFPLEVLGGGYPDFNVRQRIVLAERLRNWGLCIDAHSPESKHLHIFRHETRNGAVLDSFLNDVVNSLVEGATPDDSYNALKLLTL